ncbi:MAG: serine hydrolase [Saprospiraceae bacterium]
MIKKANILLLILSLTTISELAAFPFDGFIYSGIKRLYRLQLIHEGKMKGKTGPVGQNLKMEDIKLNLTDNRQMSSLPEVDPKMQEALEDVIPNRQKRYSVTVMDITPGRPVRYAAQKPDITYQPGSVGKLAVLTGLFRTLHAVYPNDYEKRIEILKCRQVTAREWAMSDHHTVPFFDIDTEKYFKRTVRESDVFTLFEWIDHMVSVSNNGAASVLWREGVLMQVFGKKYEDLTEAEAEEYFKSVNRKELSRIAIGVVNDPLREICIGVDEWRLGSLFTRGGKNRIAGYGGSSATPAGLMKWLMALESGTLVDEKSSLEMKRLMYVTDRRIRYAATNELDSAAVYFKSGSFYKCNRTTMPNCGKYMGNVYNYMNSVAIVEQPDSTKYMVALMTNVLGKNSNWDHRLLAKNIDAVVRKGFGDKNAKVNLEEDPEDNGE